MKYCMNRTYKNVFKIQQTVTEMGPTSTSLSVVTMQPKEIPGGFTYPSMENGVPTVMILVTHHYVRWRRMIL